MDMREGASGGEPPHAGAYREFGDENSLHTLCTHCELVYVCSLVTCAARALLLVGRAARACPGGQALTRSHPPALSRVSLYVGGSGAAWWALPGLPS